MSGILGTFSWGHSTLAEVQQSCEHTAFFAGLILLWLLVWRTACALWAVEAQRIFPRKLYRGQEMREEKEKLCADAAAVYWIFSRSAQPLRYTQINAERFGSWSWGEASLTVTPLGTHHLQSGGFRILPSSKCVRRRQCHSLTVPFLPTEHAGWPQVIVQGDKLRADLQRGLCRLKMVEG